jgi:adenine deaminase
LEHPSRREKAISYLAIPVLAFVLHIVPLQAQTDASATTPDTVLVNGHVFTGSTADPYVEAVSIWRNRILAIGTSKAILLTAGKSTRQIDLGGRLVIPGINDSHVHFEAEVIGTKLDFGADLDPSCS